MCRNNRKSGGFTLTDTIALVLFVVILVLGAFVLPPRYVNHGTGNRSPINTCINNLRIIDGAKGQWAMEHNKQSTDTPAASDIQPYMGHGPAIEMPSCPNDPKHTFATSYSINNVGSVPTCKISPTNHVLR